MADGARQRREAMRQLDELRRRLATAEDALAAALAAMKQAEEAFDVASDRFDAAESALDTARAERARTRVERYTARQAHEQASTNVDRLQRRVRELSALGPDIGVAGTPADRLNTCSNRVGRHAATCLVVLPGAVCQRARVGPGLVLVSWERCHCAPTRAAHPERAAWGHLTVACRVTGCRSVWYRPRHDPGAGLAVPCLAVGAEMGAAVRRQLRSDAVRYRDRGRLNRL